MLFVFFVYFPLFPPVLGTGKNLEKYKILANLSIHCNQFYFSCLNRVNITTDYFSSTRFVINKQKKKQLTVY